MDKYTTLCSPEQTKRAYRLGAPIKTHLGESAPHGCTVLDFDEHSEISLYGEIPTIEQMLGWLEEKDILPIVIPTNTTKHEYEVAETEWSRYIGRANALAAAIDSCLTQLEQ